MLLPYAFIYFGFPVETRNSLHYSLPFSPDLRRLTNANLKVAFSSHLLEIFGSEVCLSITEREDS